MGRFFGTDGVRGIANGDLTAELAMNIGRAAAIVVRESIGRKPVFLVGKDPRISSDMLEAAISSGLCSAGADVVCLGIVPTPAVAYLVGKYHADAGVMLSASHNPYEYNGIKIFSGDGYKLRDEQEEEIEQMILGTDLGAQVRSVGSIGKIRWEFCAVEDYVAHLAATAADGFSGIRLALDCSNGSASASAKMLFERLGAQCDVFHAQPDGMNINRQCGSTYMNEISGIVKKGGYDLGLAFDGDADRCLAVDENGAVVDGDQLIAIFAYYMNEQGTLKNNTFVATVMSNLGLFKFAEKRKLGIEKTQVGDRYVLQRMLEQDFSVGGEQSGHIIFRDYMTTGDGQLSGVQLLRIMKQTGKKLSELAALMRKYPQTLVNVHATAEKKQAFLEDISAKAVIEKLESLLGDDGRILVRPSGTEPLIRIMVEGPDEGTIEKIAAEIADVIEGRPVCV